MLLVPASGWAKDAAGTALREWKPGLLDVTVFDVGKADAILLKLPDGRYAMIDTGFPETAPRLIKELKALKVKTIDLIVLTHFDRDHVGGYPHILEAFKVGRVVQSYDPKDKKKEPLVKVGTKIIDEKGLTMTVLGPEKAYDDENDASLVTRLDFGDISFLFAGDAVEKAQADILKANVTLRANVLKVPHHGRYTKFSPRPFFSAVKAAYAVITCDEKNGDPPEGSVMRMLDEADTKVFRTDLMGTVSFITDGKTLNVQGGRQ